MLSAEAARARATGCGEREFLAHLEERIKQRADEHQCSLPNVWTTQGYKNLSADSRGEIKALMLGIGYGWSDTGCLTW